MLDIDIQSTVCQYCGYAILFKLGIFIKIPSFLKVFKNVTTILFPFIKNSGDRNAKENHIKTSVCSLII